VSVQGCATGWRHGRIGLKHLQGMMLSAHIISDESNSDLAQLPCSHAQMNASQSPTASGLSDAERSLLRKSVREFLQNRWPADNAVERAGNAQAIAALWRELAGLGLAALGSDAAEAGAREIVLVFEELGRASCPAPLLGAVAANLALGGGRSNAAQAMLQDLHRGEATIAVALGAFDGDPAASRAQMRGDVLSGTTSFVEGAQAATHLLVFTDSPAGVAIVANGAPGLRLQATPGLAVPPFCELAFENTPARRMDVAPELLADIALLARLACGARALGAAQRAFELAVEHAKVRKQFGQLIGQFQAVQHKLANCLIELDGARLTLESAAEARDGGVAEWRVFASSALAFAGPALRDVIIRTHQALGAIGYAEEHEAPRHFRRVHADLARFGGVSRARAELADYLLGPQP
jgi:alkylation response protein AidB-like acyl-CoA dehydrogenase